MFTRSNTAEPKSLEPVNSNSNAGLNMPQRRQASAENATKSVIGNDLKISGQGLKIIGQGVLQIDGEIGGDVLAAEVIVGEQGKVTGMVGGAQVVVRGKVSGVICAKTIALQSSCEVEGDIHHMSLTIEQGAMFDGRSRRAASESDLSAVLNAKTATQS